MSTRTHSIHRMNGKIFLTIFLIQFWRLNFVLLIFCFHVHFAFYFYSLRFFSLSRLWLLLVLHIYFSSVWHCWWFAFSLCVCVFTLFSGIDTCMAYSESFFSLLYSFHRSTLSCLCYFFASTVKRITSFFTRDMSHALVYIYLHTLSGAQFFFFAFSLSLCWIHIILQMQKVMAHTHTNAAFLLSSFCCFVRSY